jgi:hypothetical protein
MKRLFFIFFVTLLSAACTHSLHLAHVGDFSPTYKGLGSGKMIQAKADQFVVMGFVQNTDYVDSAYAQLQAACPNGSIQGIMTQYSTSHGFFSWTNHIDMQGLCLSR